MQQLYQLQNAYCNTSDTASNSFRQWATFCGRCNSRISTVSWNWILSHFSILKRRKCFGRHLRALTFENSALDNYAESLPFVQRILNSNYSDRLKVSSAQLLFGNVINHDRGIFLPVEERQKSSKPLSKHTSKMLAIQNSLVKAAAKELLRTDLLHMTEQTFPYTEFEPNSYVLVHYRSGAPPSRLHTFWRGPMKVIVSK